MKESHTRSIDSSLLAPRYLTLKQAAAYLSLSPRSLYRLIDSCTIPFTPINVMPRESDKPKRVHYRFDRLTLDAFMAARAVVPPDYLLSQRQFSPSKR